MEKLINDFKVSCQNCNLDAICLPRGLNQAEINELSIEVKTNVTIDKGEFIYHQGDRFNRIVAIKSGSAKLVNLDNHGNEHILNVLLPGELIGFDGLFQNRYNCSAIALEKTSFCVLPAANLEALSCKIPSINRELFKHCSETVNHAQNLIVSTKCPADEKIAMFLVNLSDRLKARGFSAVEFHIPLTRQEMGNHLGLTLETVSRMLQHFQQAGLISINRKLIKILDLNALRAIFDH